METPYFEKTKVDFNNDYRYFYMDSDKYYYELSEMSNMLSNMIKEKEGRNMLYDTENSYRALGIESYMWYMGLNHREVGRLENEYNDVNTCKYALGERGLVYSTGSSKRSCNLIVVVVGGNKEEEKLMANVHGVIGNDGRYDMKYHIGYEITADRVYEKFKEYEKNFHGDKVYWVVGSEVGGSVANLLAKKIIDEKGRDKVFCYTFNAMNTINLNELKGEINNKKYNSIFNIENLDDYRLQIFSRENNFRKYGITRAFYMSEQKRAVKEKWEERTFSRYEVVKKNMIQILKDLLGLKSVKGYTEESIDNEFDPLDFTTYRTNDDYERGYEYYYRLLRNIKTNRIMTTEEEAKTMTTDIKNTLDTLEAYINSEEIIKRIKETITDTIPDDKDTKKYNNDYFKPTNTNNTNSNENDPRDGIEFVEYAIEDYKNKSNLDVKSNETCVRVGEFVYSNYTLPSSVSHYDVDYSKFWSTNNDGDGGKLFEYKIGENVGGGQNNTTKFTLTRLRSAVTVNNKSNILDKTLNGKNKTFGNGLLSIDDRIVAYFPIPVYSQGKEDISLMHKYNNYYEENVNEGKYHGFNGKGGMNEKDTVTFNLVDVVFEKYKISDNGDKISTHQFVIPFVVGGTKWLHQSREKMMYSMFTDNRYGQVYERIATPNLAMRSLEGNFYKYVDENNEEILLNKKLENSKLGGKKFIEFVVPTGIEKTIYNTYPSVYDEREFLYCSPIEPIIDSGSGDVTTALINQVFPDNNYGTRIVSMRVYDVDVEEQKGEYNEKNWKKNINKDLPNYQEHNGDFGYKYTETYFYDYEKNNKNYNRIVLYPAINNSE